MEEMLTTFLISVLAGIACHYICKWLNGNKDSSSLED